jgi:integrase
MKTPTEFPKNRPELDLFPFKAIRGNEAVTIYFVRDGNYDAFKIPYYQDGKRRKFHRFPNYEGARDKGNEMLDQLARGDSEAIALSNTDKLIYLRALETLRPTGIALDVAVAHFVKAFEILGGDYVISAAQDYARRQMNKVKPCLIPAAVEEFIATQERRQHRRKLSDVHVRRQAARLRAFAECAKVNVGSVTADDIDQFLDALKKKDDSMVGPRTRDNWADEIVAFFEWAKIKRYVPDEYSETSRITRLDRDEDGPIEIYSPEEFGRLVSAAAKENDRGENYHDLIPFLVIGGFAGLRTSEFLRLQWEDVRLTNGAPKIIIQRGKVRKRGKSRRIVPVSQNLRAWLADIAQESGPVWPHSEPQLYKRLQSLAKAVELAWKNNALRHSFVSYRMATVNDENQVALEAGNSPQIIFSNYRELVDEEGAKRWFAINPAATESPAAAKA